MSEEQYPEKVYDSIYTPGIRSHISSIPEQYLSTSEEKLERELRPTTTLYSIRQSWWREVMDAEEADRRMQPVKVYEGICSKQYFDKILHAPKKLAWILKPLSTYETKLEALLERAIKRYDDLLAIDFMVPKQIVNRETKKRETIMVADPKLAAVLLQSIKNIEDRVKGTPLQRQAIQTEDINKTRQIEETRDVNELDAKIAEIQAKLEGNKQEVRLLDENTIEVQTKKVTGNKRKD